MNTRNALICCSLATLLSGTGAQAGETVDKTLPVDADGVVAIENLRGSVEVLGWDRAEVQVTGELDDLAEKLVFEHDGKRTRIEVKMPDDNVDSGDGSSLTVRVPAASRVETRGVSCDTTVKGVQGGIEVHSVSGDVVASGLNGELLVKTVSGDVKLDTSLPGGSVQFKTVSGDIELSVANRAVELSTVSGDVELALEEFDQLDLNTVSGDLKVSGVLARNGRVKCQSVSGNCELRLRGKVDARVSVRTGPGGEIVNALDSTRVTEEFPSQQRLDTTLGDGSATISASTVSGEIKLAGE